MLLAIQRIGDVMDKAIIQTRSIRKRYILLELYEANKQKLNPGKIRAMGPLGLLILAKVISKEYAILSSIYGTQYLTRKEKKQRAHLVSVRGIA